MNFTCPTNRAKIGYDRKYIASITTQKAVMQALSIIDCPAEPHLLPVLVKVKKILAKRPSHSCAQTHVSLDKGNMVHGCKTTTMMNFISH